MTTSSKSYKELEEIEKPSAMVSLMFTNKGKNFLSGLEKFKNLIELDLSGNSLSSQVTEVLQLKFLKKLNLSRNSISALWDLPKSLEQLSVSENFLTSLSLVIPSLTRLQSLDISQNCINSLLPLENLPHLRNLYAKNNKIGSVEGLENCRELVELDLECNNLQSVSDLLNLASLSIISLKGNPFEKTSFFEKIRSTGFAEHEEGLFCRNPEKVKFSKFKEKKTKKEVFLRQRKRPTYRSRITSMQEIYDQVISEDPEMESLNSSGSEEKLLDEFKKPAISKLQLDKLETSDKVSSGKWSTKPESSFEYLLEDLVQTCGLGEEIQKNLDTDQRVEFIFCLIKEHLIERKRLKKEIAELEEKIRNFEAGKSKNEKILDFSKEIQCLKENVKLQTDRRKKELFGRDGKMKGIKGVEDERNSARFNFSYSYDSDFTDFSEIGEGKLEDKNVYVSSEVAEYIQNLLNKISRLVSKTKKMRLENQRLKYLFDHYHKSSF